MLGAGERAAITTIIKTAIKECLWRFNLREGTRTTPRKVVKVSIIEN